ncbi:MAG: hypothetical protein LBH95_06445 [Oscillospiraceae bacterium]|nr:hypothetical protein [Oscillospiraceae bacterium]
MPSQQKNRLPAEHYAQVKQYYKLRDDVRSVEVLRREEDHAGRAAEDGAGKSAGHCAVNGEAAGEESPAAVDAKLKLGKRIRFIFYSVQARYSMPYSV